MRQGKITAGTVVASTEETKDTSNNHNAAAGHADGGADKGSLHSGGGGTEGGGDQITRLSGDDDKSEGPSTYVAPTPSTDVGIAIRLNGSTAKVGRPRLNRAEQRQQEKVH